MIDQDGDAKGGRLQPKPKYTHVVCKVCSCHGGNKQDQGGIVQGVILNNAGMSLEIQEAVIKSSYG